MGNNVRRNMLELEVCSPHFYCQFSNSSSHTNVCTDKLSSLPLSCGELSTPLEETNHNRQTEILFY